MTHTMHRFGTQESLKGDFVWLFYPSVYVKVDNLIEKTVTTIDIIEECNCVNWGDVKNTIILAAETDEIKNKLREDSRIRGVFISRDDVVRFLKKMKEADLGVPVIISGLLSEILPAVEESGLKPHTINFSLGIWGKKELLPADEILAITTMCGHHMISPGIAERVIQDVATGKMTARNASMKIAPLCACGIFNQVRAEKLIADAASRRQGRAPNPGNQ